MLSTWVGCPSKAYSAVLYETTHVTAIPLLLSDQNVKIRYSHRKVFESFGSRIEMKLFHAVKWQLKV